MLRDLSEVKIGDPVVHDQHGIGRYLGLQSMDLGEGETEFLHLEYANETKLYVPVAQLHLISRYSGAAPDAAPLHHARQRPVGKAKRKAAEQVRDTAAELLNLYAHRAAREGHAFEFKQHDYEAFAERFPFEETPDQAGGDQRRDRGHERRQADGSAGVRRRRLRQDRSRAARGVRRGRRRQAGGRAVSDHAAGRTALPDLPRSLRRLAGTNRRAFALPLQQGSSAIGGRHQRRYDRYRHRHAQALDRVDVKFKSLGLVIIDEEHRFGVRQKERLKALRAEVDVLTLTATPIPRTLAMSLEGMRDFSVIATAPQRRLAIKTFVREESPALIREAVLRELKRGGQVYFLHNEVDTIDNRRRRLAELVPEARIAIAHGQMRERELERVMRDFYQQRFNLLLCTTIIETGIDVPTANTIIINRADRFGLAQLHQLRGRVGRSHHQAYAYLLLPEEGNITTQAKKRLEAIQMMEELGSRLLSRDARPRDPRRRRSARRIPERRDAGSRLQSLLADAERGGAARCKLGPRARPAAPLGVTTEINLHVPALLPTDYVNDVHERLSMYKRLASADNEDELIERQEELVDRYGKLPEAAKALLETHRLRLTAEKLGVKKIDASADAIVIQFVPDPPFDTAKLIQMMQRAKTMRLAGPSGCASKRKQPTSTRGCCGCAKCSERSADQRFTQDELRSAVGKAIEPARCLVAEPVIELRRLEAERIEVEQPAAALERYHFGLAHQRSADPSAAHCFVHPYLLQLARRSPPAGQRATDQRAIGISRIAREAVNRLQIGAAPVVGV